MGGGAIASGENPAGYDKSSHIWSKFSKNPARQYISMTAPPDPMKPDCVLRKVEDIDVVEQVILVVGTVSLEQKGDMLIIFGVSL